MGFFLRMAGNVLGAKKSKHFCKSLALRSKTAGTQKYNKNFTKTYMIGTVAYRRSKLVQSVVIGWNSKEINIIQ